MAMHADTIGVLRACWPSSLGGQTAADVAQRQYE